MPTPECVHQEGIHLYSFDGKVIVRPSSEPLPAACNDEKVIPWSDEYYASCEAAEKLKTDFQTLGLEAFDAQCAIIGKDGLQQMLKKCYPDTYKIPLHKVSPGE